MGQRCPGGAHTTCCPFRRLTTSSCGLRARVTSIASNQMLLNFGRTRSPDGSSREMGELATVVGRTRCNTSANLVWAFAMPAIRLIDTRFASHRERYVIRSGQASHRQGTGDRTRHEVQVACAEEQPTGCARTDVGSDSGTNLHGVGVFRGGQVGKAMPHRFAGAAPRAPVSPRPAIRRQAATHPSIPPTAGDREADFLAYEPSPPPSPLANPVLPSRSG